MTTDEPRDITDRDLDRLLAALPRALGPHDGSQEVREEALLRELARGPRPGSRRLRPLLRIAACALIFAGGYTLAMLAHPHPDLEADIRGLAARPIAEQRALVQRAGTAYLRAVVAAVRASNASSAQRALGDPVHLTAWAAMQSVSPTGTDSCVGARPLTSSSYLVSF